MLREKFTENSIYSQFFSFEVLDYFDSISTDENYEWIVKYFDVLMKEENKTAEKFDKHHIVPCALLKDENHKIRSETVVLANEINENLVKLSVQNHIIAHYCLWKMFPINEDIRRPIYLMLGKINKEKYQKRHKEYYENNKEEINRKERERRKNHKEEFSEKEKERRERLCYDPIEEENCNYNTLKRRKSKYKEKYKDVILKDCVIPILP